jgi:Transposase DDE domain
MHTLLDLHSGSPTFIRIADGKVHNVNIFDQILIETGAYYLMDRGYFDFVRLNTRTSALTSDYPSHT